MVESLVALAEPVWLGKAAAAGFQDVQVLSRSLMDEDRLTRYPVYVEGGLDALFDLVTPAERWGLVESATIRALKPRSGGRPRKRTGPLVCQV